MSIDALRWAWEQEIRPATAKFVLVSIADRADETHRAYPSISRIVKDTCLNRKTVMISICKLEELGKLSTEKRYGAVTVYQLIGVKNRHESDENQSQNRHQFKAKNQSQNRYQSQKRYQSQNRDHTSTEIGTIPVPKTGHRTQKNRKEPPTCEKQGQPEGVDAQAWADFCEHRESSAAMRKGWTPLARKKSANLLAKFPSEQQREIVDKTIRSGWTGLFPDRVLKKPEQPRRRAI